MNGASGFEEAQPTSGAISASADSLAFKQGIGHSAPVHKRSDTIPHRPWLDQGSRFFP